MKRILSYALPLIAAAGMAIGCQKCEKKVKEEVPTQVTVENVKYHEFEQGKPVCLYYNSGSLFTSSDGESRPGSYAVILEIKATDPNLIKQVEVAPLPYGDEDEYGRPIVLKSKRSEYIYNTALSVPGPYKNLSARLRITDWQGNVVEHRITLEDALKKAEPAIARPKTTKWCPRKIE